MSRDAHGGARRRLRSGAPEPTAMDRPLGWTGRWYRRALWLYPATFRQAHGEEMVRVFRDLEHDAAAAGRRGPFLWAALRDAVSGAWRTRRTGSHSNGSNSPVGGLPGRRQRKASSMTTLPHDLRLAVRRLLRSPAFTCVAVLTIALGIGANTAIFSVVYGVLLRPLPLDDPDRLAVLSYHRIDLPSDAQGFYPVHVELLRSLETGTDDAGFAGFTSFMWDSLTLEGEGDALEVGGALVVDGRFFEVLRVEPLVGRTLGPEDVSPGRRGDTAVLGESFWASAFGRDETILGRTIQLDGRPVQVVGVVADDAPLPQAGVPLWIAQGWSLEDRTLYGRLSMMARLGDGISFERAGARLASAAASIAAQHPRMKGYTIGADRFEERLVGSARPALLALAGGVGLILLLACTNLASLLIARVAGRRRDVATRRALGARWRHLVSQHVAESLVLSALGGAAGLGLAFALHRLLTTMASGLLPRLGDVRLDLPVLLFALGLTALAGWLVGLVPVLYARAHDLAQTLRGARSGGPGTHRARGVLVTVQVALAVVLAVGAVLMMRTLYGLAAVDPGFDPDGVGAARVYLDDESYGDDAEQALYARQILASLRARPDVERAGAGSALPFDPITIDYDLPYTLRGEDEDASRQAQFRVITPGFLETLGIPLRRGRAFDDGDREGGEQVALINETFAEVAWPGVDPLGATFSFYGGRRTVRIVGVVGDVTFRGPSDVPRPEFFIPNEQHPFGALTVVARLAAGRGGESAEDAGSRAALAIADEALVVDPSQPVHSAFSVASLERQAVAGPRFLLLLLGAFAAVALALAAAGIYGLLAGWIADSRREIGVRIALGAAGTDITRWVVGRGLLATLSGLAAGLVLARLAAGSLVPFLFGVEATDLAVHLLVAAAVVTLGAAVSLVPALRAARIEPSQVLTVE